MEPVTSDARSPEPPPPYQEHQGPHREYMRDIILGVNDGLVSIFLLVVGVVAGGFSSKAVLIAATAAAIAGAISMASGEYIATKSQEEVLAGEMDLEREHLIHHRAHELAELREMFDDMSLDPADAERIVSALDKNDEALLRVMMALEFGYIEEDRRSPITAMIMSGLLFLAGALPSLLPFIFIDRPGVALSVAMVAAGLALFAVGMAKTFATRGNPWRAGAENLAVAAAGGLAAYAIGSLFDGVTS